VIKDKKDIKPRVLELNRETVVQLTQDLLKKVVGGNSLHPSQCVGDRCV
jgi:hypothetical protein